MSEYQYYEFVALDEPLTPQQQAELRARSTRATITATSFINEYHWGDLKGDPMDWMRRYFDAHVYSANWCSCRLLLRLPRAAFDQATLDDFTQRSPMGSESRFIDAFEVTATPEHWILDWSFNDDAGEYDRFWTQADGPGWLSRLLPLRDELLRGDHRPLYLGWLARVCRGELDDADLEPPLPAGLKTLTPAQTALTEFLLIDPDWLAAAAEASEDLAVPAGTDSALDDWLALQTAADLRATLRLLLEGRGQEAERGLRKRFVAWQRLQQRTEQAQPARHALARIAERREACAAMRQAREQAAQSVRETWHRAERSAHLTQLAARADAVWASIDQTLQRGSGAGYDQALKAVQELAEALALTGRENEFNQGLARLMSTHGRRPSWVSRLTKAGLSWGAR